MAVVLTWNPQRWDFPDGVYERNVELTQRPSPSRVPDRWSAGGRRHGVEVGERAFLLRQGQDRRGVVAAGRVTATPYPGPHWDGSSREAWFVDVEWDRFVEIDDRVPTEELIEQVPSVPWNYLFGSGAPLDDAETAVVEALWTGADTAHPDDEALGGVLAVSAEVREDATDLLRRLIGAPLRTVTGHLNRILAVTPPQVFVATERSPQGRPVPIGQVESALETLRREGSLTVEPEQIGYRSAFLGAVLLTLPGVRAYGSPPVLTLTRVGAEPREGLEDQQVSFDGDLVHLREAAQRGEQTALRGRLFGSRDDAVCALCGQSYPVRFLHAAHIKRRAVCEDRERRDLDAIAIPACVFGCDALYELGYIAVDATGTIVTTDRHHGGALAEHLAQLAGRPCPAFAPRTTGYFAWHHTNVFRA